MDELERKKAHRAAVAGYLRDQHRRHFGRQSIYEDGPAFSLGPANVDTEDYRGFAADMGMRGIDGLRPPALALPRTPEPLHVAERQFQPKLRVGPRPAPPAPPTQSPSQALAELSLRSLPSFLPASSLLH